LTYCFESSRFATSLLNLVQRVKSSYNRINRQRSLWTSVRQEANGVRERKLHPPKKMNELGDSAYGDARKSRLFFFCWQITNVCSWNGRNELPLNENWFSIHRKQWLGGNEIPNQDTHKIIYSVKLNASASRELWMIRTIMSLSNQIW